ncbi:MAG: GtrA family protein [Candidatus Amulumruptor caecigallinarius]|nr:GtrA family protein [Candidatus Amulumruptor caecigallinarius]MCM1397405.1 GtrA family protein [Candidatus Amulumruptor caecigallinarius]MCM1454490.1 GtrA family protein [bacterium]
MQLPARVKEIIRFGITGTTATVVLYGTYLLLLQRFDPSLSYSVAFAVGVCVNYVMTTSFTFRVKRSVRNGIGFIFCNVINYAVSMTLLRLFLAAGTPEAVAPVPTILLATISNYLITRAVMRHF